MNMQSPAYPALATRGVKSSVLDTIGHTPVVRLNNIGPPDVNIFAKLESANPLGSVKDRLAIGVIEDAEKSRALIPGQTVIEATSGNTGIGLAMVCAQKGYPLVIVMAENFSVERRKLMRFLGARVILTPASEKASGMMTKARALANKHGWFFANQFSNPANAAIHTQTTAVEILADFKNVSLDYWITGAGTGGTLLGVGRMLRDHAPTTKIVAVEPDNAAMLASGMGNTGPSDTHTLFRPHLMQGWSPDFLSDLLLDARDRNLVDVYCSTSGDAALQTARDLARREGILAGISGGATVAAALQLAKEVPAGTNLLAMIPDTGERYISTQLFDDIGEDMNPEETSISHSTDGQRFGAASAPAPIPTVSQVSPKAANFVHQHVTAGAYPVVMFALQWCEFCWSVRKLFDAMNLPYVSVDLDAANFEGGQSFAGDVRKVLLRDTGAATIPQIYAAGQHLGGATETFDAFNNGNLQRVLIEAGQTFTQPDDLNAYTLLPKWIHRR